MQMQMEESPPRRSTHGPAPRSTVTWKQLFLWLMTSAVRRVLMCCLLRVFKRPEKQSGKFTGKDQLQKSAIWGQTSTPLLWPHDSPRPPARSAHMGRLGTSSLRLLWVLSIGPVWPRPLCPFKF